MGLFDSIDEEIQAKTASAISYLGKKIGRCETFKLMRYVVEGKDFFIGVTQLLGLEKYKLYFSTNSNSGHLFIFITDAIENEAIGFLAHLASFADNGEKYFPEQVITVGNTYFDGHHFSGLVFLSPEDMEIFGDLKCESFIGGVECKVLSLLLKKDEMELYKQYGFKSIISCLSDEKRDFLSVY